MKRSLIAFLAFVIAYVASRVIFAAIGFTYNIFSEPFSVSKLILDFGVWGAVYILSYFVLSRALRSKKS